MLVLFLLVGLMYIFRVTRMEEEEVVYEGDVLLGGVWAGLDLLLTAIGDLVVTCLRHGLLLSLLEVWGCC